MGLFSIKKWEFYTKLKIFAFRMPQTVNFASQTAENQADALKSALKQYFYVSFHK